MNRGENATDRPKTTTQNVFQCVGKDKIERTISKHAREIEMRKKNENPRNEKKENIPVKQKHIENWHRSADKTTNDTKG